MKKDYTKYDPIEFAQDDKFIKWVKGGHPAANSFWEQWITDTPSKEKDIEEAKHLVKAIRIKEEAPDKQQIKNLWDRIESGIAVEEKAPVKMSRLRVIQLISAAAAACIAFLLIFYFLGPSDTTIKTDYAQFASETLPDGSVVQLNAGSSIAFNPKEWEKHRIVELTGEAFFDVKKGTPFMVKTPAGTVTVLGTSFNVLARNSDFEVTCFTGKVSVKKEEGAERILTRGQHTRSLNGAALSAVVNTDLEKKAGWRQRSFYYVNYPISKVFSEVERQFDVKIEAEPSVLNNEGNFIFESNNLDSALQKICWPFHLEYSIQGNTVIVEETK